MLAVAVVVVVVVVMVVVVVAVTWSETFVNNSVQYSIVMSVALLLCVMY